MIDVEVRIPALGESMSEATVGKILFKPGAFVKSGDVIFELETDKVNLEVQAETSGTIKSINYAEGGIVKTDDVFCIITEGAQQEKAKQEAAPEKSVASNVGVNESSSGSQLQSPAAAKIVREMSIDTSSMTGSALGGVLTKKDVLSQSAGAQKSEVQAKPTTSAPSAAANNCAVENDGETQTVKMSRLRKSVAERLKWAQNNAAILTTYNEVDMSVVMNARKTYQDLFTKKHGTKIGFMSFFVKAVTTALTEMPIVNAEICGDDIIYKNFFHIGVAIGSEAGLVVPILRHADRMSFAEIEKSIINFAQKAKERTLKIEEMKGGTFTISNGGTYGSLLSAPILNPPQSAILGMHTIQERPVVVNSQIVIRPMMYLALSYDHRLIDGKEAVTFLVRIKQLLEDPCRVVFGV